MLSWRAKGKCSLLFDTIAVSNCNFSFAGAWDPNAFPPENFVAELILTLLGLGLLFLGHTQKTLSASFHWTIQKQIFQMIYDTENTSVTRKRKLSLRETWADEGCGSQTDASHSVSFLPKMLVCANWSCVFLAISWALMHGQNIWRFGAWKWLHHGLRGQCQKPPLDLWDKCSVALVVQILQWVVLICCRCDILCRKPMCTESKCWKGPCSVHHTNILSSDYDGNWKPVHASYVLSTRQNPVLFGTLWFWWICKSIGWKRMRHRWYFQTVPLSGLWSRDANLPAEN